MDPLTDLEGYLTSKGCVVKRSGNQIHTHCFFCGEEKDKRGRLYIDDSAPDSRGLYKCFLCDAKGNLRTLLTHFGDPLPNEHVVDDRRMAINTWAARFYHENLREADRRWLREERGLTDETIDRFMLGYASGGTQLLDFLLGKNFTLDEIRLTGLAGPDRNGEPQDFHYKCITIPYMVGAGCVQIRGRMFEGHAKYRTPPGQKARLFNSIDTFSAETVIIAEGEFDAMILSQLGYNAVGVPGSTNWTPDWNNYLKEVTHVFIVFDPDDAGRQGSAKIEGMLGPKAKPVTLPVAEDEDAKNIDPTSLVVEKGWSKDDFDALIKTTKRESSLLLTPVEAWQNWETHKGQAGLKLGMEHLDYFIDPGLLPGQVIIPLGKTNVGKTQVLLNVFQRVLMVPGQENTKILYISLEQMGHEWFSRARRIWNFYNLDTDPTQVDRLSAQFWNNHMRIVEKNRVTEIEMLQILADYEEEMGQAPDLVAIDYLGYWARGFRGKDRYERVSEAVMTLKAVAKQTGARVISPHQVNRNVEFGQEFEIDDGRESGVIEETADFALSMWRPDQQKGTTTKSGQLKMKLGKSRHGHAGAELSFQTGVLTQVMIPETDNPEDRANCAKAKREATWEQQGGVSWEDAILAHKTGLPPGKSWA